MTNSFSSDDSLEKEEIYSYEIKTLSDFPANIFDFKDYNFAKAIALGLLIFTSIYTFLSFIDLIKSHYRLPPISLREWFSYIEAFFYAFYSIFSNLLNIFHFVFILFPLGLSMLIAWLIFEPREVSNFVLGITNIILGIIGILNPADTIPDFIPVFGTTDDVFSGGLVGLGAWLLSIAAKRRENYYQVIKQLKEGKINETEGLNLLLADKGIVMNKIKED
jgi:uncharacterized membrane protein YkvA (DUF1232 family)